MTDPEALALAMYERNATALGGTRIQLDEGWSDEGVREFWIAEAEYALQFIADNE